MPTADVTCPLCGSANAPGAAACHDCGRPLDAEGRLIANRYEVLDVRGRGGMGVIFRARDRELEEIVAVKTLRPDVAGRRDMVQRLRSEIKLARRVRHRNVCAIHEFGEDGGLVFVVMDFIDGQNVGELISGGTGLALDKAFDIAIQGSRGLSAIHEAEIVHRDFKPSNLMLDSRGVVRVLDFGIAKGTLESDTSITATGQIIGTPAYMSPEQITGQVVGPPSDLYALGCVVFELFTGEPPFKGDSPVTTMMRTLNDPPPLSGASAERIPRSVVPILARLLAKAPEDRISGAAQVVRLLEEAREIELRRETTQTFSADSLNDVATPPPGAAGRSARAAAPESGPVTPTGAQATASPWPGASRPEVSPPPGQAWQALDAALPDSMRASSGALRQFLNASFQGSTPVSQGLVRLHGIRLGDVGGFQFFALLIGADSDPDKVGTRTFIAYASPLESQLASLPQEDKKVVIVVTESHSLGAGVRQKILEYRQKRNALVVPLYLGEICKAQQTGTLVELLKGRLDDYHAQADLFASRGPLSDPTTFFGMRELLNDLVATLQEGERQPIVCGPPGSGKTSVIKMASYDMIGTRFLTVRCSHVVRRTPAHFLEELARAVRPPSPAQARARPADGEIPWDPSHVESAFADVAALERSSGLRPILVLEDADWLIEALCRPGEESDRRTQMRELWSALFECARERGVPLAITSVQGFWLSQRRIGDWENPFAKQIRLLGVPPLTLAETRQMVSELGVQMNVEFEKAALARVFAEAAGNLDLTRRLCSTAIRLRRQSQAEALALSRLVITRADIVAAADELAADPRTFEHLMQWLDDSERDLLRLIAEVRPRGVRDLAWYAADPANPDGLRRGTERLHEIGLLRRSGRRERPFIPIFEEWLRRNVALPEYFKRKRAVVRTRLAAATLGFATLLLAVLAGRSGVGREGFTEFRVHDCTYQVYFPESAAEQSDITLRAYRTACLTAPPPDDAVFLLFATTTNARVGESLAGSLRIPMKCAETRCAREGTVRLIGTTERAFRLTLDGASPPREIAIRKDPWARVGDYFSRTAAGILSLLGAASSLVAAFEKLASLVQRVGSGVASLYGQRLP
jgi:serine/threonine protein kinase